MIVFGRTLLWQSATVSTSFQRYQKCTRPWCVSSFVLLAVMALGCKGLSEPSIELRAVDLLPHGVPLTIQAPPTARVKAMDWGVQKDITINDDDWYQLQIFYSTAQRRNPATLIREMKQLVEEGRYFSQFLVEEDAGFIFEVSIDSVINYDFRHIKIQGDREYSFQAGMSGMYTLPQIELLYRMAKEAK